MIGHCQPEFFQKGDGVIHDSLAAYPPQQANSVCLAFTVMPRKNYSLRSIVMSPKRSASPSPPSPTFSDTTQASAINFGLDGPEKIITRANLRVSLQAYDEVCIVLLRYALIHRVF